MKRYDRRRPPLNRYIYLIGSLMIGFGGGLLAAASLAYPALWGWGLLVGGSLLLALSAPLWKPT